MEAGGPKKVAELSRVSISTLNAAIAGRNEPKIGFIAHIADAIGASLDFIVFGKEPVAEASTQPSRSDGGKVGDEVFVQVPFYNIRASAGPGAAAMEDDSPQTYAIARSFLLSLNVLPERGAMLTVQGDSASPTLYPGDIILIDRALHELRDGGLYVIGVDDDIVVKRVERQLDRSIILKSDNPAYSPQHVSAADSERLRVIGRVRWAIHEL